MPKKIADFEIDDETDDLELADVEDEDFDWYASDDEEEEEEKPVPKRKQRRDEEDEDEDVAEDEIADDEEEEESDEEDEDEYKVETSNRVVRELSKRVSSMEKNIDIIAAALKNRVSKRDESDEEEDDDDDEIPEELDGKALVRVLTKKIAKTVDTAVDGKLKKYESAMNEAEAARVWRSAAQKYGDPFVKAMPVLARFMIRTGINDPEQAWKGYRMLRPEQRQKLKVDAQKAQKRIARRKVDADSDDVVTERPARTPFKKLKGTDTDVFDAAFGSAVRTHIKKRR